MGYGRIEPTAGTHPGKAENLAPETQYSQTSVSLEVSTPFFVLSRQGPYHRKSRDRPPQTAEPPISDKGETPAGILLGAIQANRDLHPTLHYTHSHTASPVRHTDHTPPPDRRRVDHDATLEHPGGVLAGRKVPRSHGGSRGGAAEGRIRPRVV